MRAPGRKNPPKRQIADSMFQQALLRPKEYEVLALTEPQWRLLVRRFGCSGGWAGDGSGANIGDSAAIFEATHGSAPKYAGQDKVNPGSMLLSGAMMFEHMAGKKPQT